MKFSFLRRSLAAACCLSLPLIAADEEMDKMWGEKTVRSAAATAKLAVFDQGNYGMFIHWGLFSHLGGQWGDKTFYGIGEWIKREMKIGDKEYMAIAPKFNPAKFDAKAVVKVAQAAGMKWIIITAKHHEGFAMFKSAHPFNIVDATPFHRDPMAELAAACREAGLGFGFYYSHNQDWTAPGGSGGPKLNDDGSPASFEHYFRSKCFPQVKEICSNYGPLSFVWFDTPGDMPKELVQELAAYVRKAQPAALLCSRIGHGMGDYSSLGDMEVPPRNMPGAWECCDTTNDSWSYAWYDQNWKDSKEILRRLVGTVGRGGSYLLNVGLDGQGEVPPEAAKFLAAAGSWIAKHPDIVYGAGASPWGRALPWGDATTHGKDLNLTVFDWPVDGRLYLPGISAEPSQASVVIPGGIQPITWERQGSWLILKLPMPMPEHPASVVKLSFATPPQVDQTFGLAPNGPLHLSVEFSDVLKAEKKRISWMEKFGEWKHATQVSQWQESSQVSWDVEVAAAGDYYLELCYRGNGKTAWEITTDEGLKRQNQQSAGPIYQSHGFGLISFKTAGRHKIYVRLKEGDAAASSLESISLKRAE